MRILMPVLHYHPVIGGLENWTKNIAERLAEKAEIYVITGKVKNQPQIEIKNGVKIFRTSLIYLKNLSYSSPIYIFTTLPFILFKSLNLIKKQKVNPVRSKSPKETAVSSMRTSNGVNLLHCQGFLSGLLGYLLFQLTQIPYIVTVQRLEENKGFLRKIAYKNAKICIAASSAIKKYFQDIGCKNIEIIPNGIDLERFKNLNRQKSREKLGLKDEFVVMTVARLEKVKGIQCLIKAMSNVNPSTRLRVDAERSRSIKYQMSNFICLIIGDGSERKNLENLVKKLNLEEKVKFLGQIPNEKIPEYLFASDCFVLPSLKEGFGIAVLEAMAAGLPVIGTNVGGIPDIIEDGKNGILVEPKNPNQISQVIIKIYSQEEFSKNLVKNAWAKLEKYNWENITDRVFQIYQNLL